MPAETRTTAANRPPVAVIGCGYWGKNLVRNFYDMGVLASVADPTPDGRSQAEEIAPETHIVDNPKSIFEDERIRGVALATPAETHEELCIEAIKHGKDVFVEKPMALDAESGRRMRDAAAEHDRILMVGHLLEYHPAASVFVDQAHNGFLGKLQYIYSNRLNFGKVRVQENALWSFAPHDIAVILRLTGQVPKRVTCHGGSYITPNLADATISFLEFEDGVRAHVFVSWLNPFKEQKLVIQGDKRMVVFDDVARENKLMLYDQNVETIAGRPQLRKHGAKPIEIAPDEPLRRECSHFLDCIESRRKPLTDADSGIRVLQVLQACQDSISNGGHPVELNGS